MDEGGGMESEVWSVLACDVGNTRVAAGCVREGQASRVHRLMAGQDGPLGEALRDIWQAMPSPKALAACSVNPSRLAVLESAAGERLGQKLLLVGRDLPLPIQTDLPEPRRIGTDRLCSAAMAYERLRSACVVGSFGTAITIDCVSDEGVFLGGAILPGLAMGAEALAGGTAALPRVTLEPPPDRPGRWPDWVFGKDTRQAILGGLVVGARGALREITEAYATELGRWPPLILTGGDAELVGQDYDIVHAIVPDLCLMGVALAYELSRLRAK